MKNEVFKKTVLLSLLGHLTVFSIFSFSFGARLPQARYPNVSFWGQLLQGHQFSSNITAVSPAHTQIFLNRKPDTTGLDKVNKVAILTQPAYFKPQLSPVADSKETFIAKIAPLKPSYIRREPAIVFHPVLPYDFNFYFKDRQVAHVELMFKITPLKTGSSIMVKRNISSGNLEVDLLSLRYISRYLFMQQKSITATDWRPVKIDLSAK